MFFGKSPRFSHHFLIFGSGTADVIDKRLISRTGDRVDTGTSLREDGNDIALHFHFAVTTVSDLFGNSVDKLNKFFFIGSLEMNLQTFFFHF